MKKDFKRKSSVAAPQDELNVASLINKMQQQLSAVEKKLDILISQSSKKPFEKSYSQKPFRNFNRPSRHNRGRQDSGPGERTYTRVICAECNKECEIPFRPSGDRPVYCKVCFSKRKTGNSFNANRDNKPKERDFSQGRRFDRGHAGNRQRPFKKNKPFFARRKKHT